MWAVVSGQQLDDYSTALLLERRDENKSAERIAPEIVNRLRKVEEASDYELAVALKRPIGRIAKELAELDAANLLETNAGKHRLCFEGSVADDGPVWLSDSQLRSRKRIEIYSKTGEIDPAYSEGAMYWRAYPDGGRTINSERSRKVHGSSFYR